MSNNKEITKSIKILNINKDKKYQSNFSTSSNESVAIRTINNNNKNYSMSNIKNNSFNLYSSKKRLQSAKSISRSNKSTLTIGGGLLNKYNDYFKYNFLLSNDNKENKQNQVNLIFNNSVLNNYYNKQKSKMNTHFIKLKKIYNPHNDYYRIVKSEKNIISELVSQTNNNFNNNYKIIYSNHDSKKRNYILRCFNNIRENKSKNIDNKNSIKSIALKELYKKNNNRFNNKVAKVDSNKHIKFPDTFNMKDFIYKTDKMKIKTMKMVDEMSKNSSISISSKSKERILKSALYGNKLHKKDNNVFFKTIPKNKRTKKNNNKSDYLKNSYIES